MNEQLTIIDEPSLQFGGGQSTIDPHDGLALFGPFSRQTPSHPQSPPYIVLGTREGIELFEAWSTALNFSATIKDLRKYRLWPPYPGFEVAFGSKWNHRPVWTSELPGEDLIQNSRKRDPHERCFAVVEMFLEGFQKAKKLDSSIGVAICVVPDEVWVNCRPESRVLDPSDKGLSSGQKRVRKTGQYGLFEDYDPEQYQLTNLRSLGSFLKRVLYA